MSQRHGHVENTLSRRCVEALRWAREQQCLSAWRSRTSLQQAASKAATALMAEVPRPPPLVRTVSPIPSPATEEAKEEPAGREEAWLARQADVWASTESTDAIESTERGIAVPAALRLQLVAQAIARVAAARSDRATKAPCHEDAEGSTVWASRQARISSVQQEGRSDMGAALEAVLRAVRRGAEAGPGVIEAGSGCMRMPVVYTRLAQPCDVVEPFELSPALRDVPEALGGGEHALGAEPEASPAADLIATAPLDEQFLLWTRSATSTPTRRAPGRSVLVPATIALTPQSVKSEPEV